MSMQPCPTCHGSGQIHHAQAWEMANMANTANTPRKHSLQGGAGRRASRGSYGQAAHSHSRSEEFERNGRGSRRRYYEQRDDRRDGSVSYRARSRSGPYRRERRDCERQSGGGAHSGARGGARGGARRFKQRDRVFDIDALVHSLPANTRNTANTEIVTIDDVHPASPSHPDQQQALAQRKTLPAASANAAAAAVSCWDFFDQSVSGDNEQC